MADRPPSLQDVFNVSNMQHMASYGVPLNRSSGADADIARTWEQMNTDAAGQLTAFNQAQGTNYGELFPSWIDFWNTSNNAHLAQYGIPFDRPWDADADIARTKSGIDQQYLDAVAAWNQKYGTNFEPDQSVLGPDAQFTGFVPKPQKKGFLGGSAIGAGLGIMLAPVTGGSSLMMGALGGALGGGIQGGNFGSALKGGLLGAGAGALSGAFSGMFGGATGLSEAQIAEIVAAEGGYSALPSIGMGGSVIPAAGEGGFWDAIMQATTEAANSGGGGMNDLLEILRKAGVLPGQKGTLGNLFDIGRGIYGMYQGSKTKDIAEAAMRAENPFGPYRDDYARRLAALYADPSSITKMPGYEAGLQAVERKMASQGYLGSGNMMTALHKYGGDFFNAEADRLATLAGAKFAPGGGSQLLQGSIAGTQLQGNALNSIIYGALGLGGGGMWGSGPDARAPGSTPGINGGYLTNADLARIEEVLRGNI